jgi:hypothetical protein
MEEQWFKVRVMFPVTSSIEGHNIEDEDEDPVLRKIRLEQAGVTDNETEWAYFNIVADPIMHLMAGSYLPKDGKNKRSYTLIVFESGNSVTAVGKPEEIFKDLIEFMSKIPEKD